jgi:hypothetical protein
MDENNTLISLDPTFITVGVFVYFIGEIQCVRLLYITQAKGKLLRVLFPFFLQYENPWCKSDEVTVQVNFMKFQHIVCMCSFGGSFCNGDWMG